MTLSQHKLVANILKDDLINITKMVCAMFLCLLLPYYSQRHSLSLVHQNNFSKLEILAYTPSTYYINFFKSSQILVKKKKRKMKFLSNNLYI